jgi:Trk-type K+ transport system membrane component
MFCCRTDSQPPKCNDLPSIEPNLTSYSNKERDARITAIVLALLSLFLLAAAFVLFGVGTLPPTAMMGLGMFSYLGGVFLGFVALGILTGSFVFVAITAVRTSQREHWQAELERQQIR